MPDSHFFCIGNQFTMVIDSRLFCFICLFYDKVPRRSDFLFFRNIVWIEHKLKKILAVKLKYIKENDLIRLEDYLLRINSWSWILNLYQLASNTRRVWLTLNFYVDSSAFCDCVLLAFTKCYNHVDCLTSYYDDIVSLSLPQVFKYFVTLNHFTLNQIY